MVRIALEDLSYIYPDGTRALERVSLTIEPGERVAIVGQNGSGKSTLVRHLNGLLRPSAGRVLLDGRDIRTERVARLASRVGLAFQDPDQQIFASRVRAEVAFGARNVGLRGQELEDAIRSALAALGLTNEAERNPYDLGHSHRKLLTIASVLAMGTPVVVLDEPTTGQDAQGITLVRGVVGDLSARGRTVIVISHDVGFVADTFERIVVMAGGRVIMDGQPGEVFAEDQWQLLGSTSLEPPLPARIGARYGLGSTPTDQAFVDAFTAAMRAGRLIQPGPRADTPASS